MEQRRLSAGALLNERGELNEAGYANALVKQYDRSAIRAGKLRIKEWDYYLIMNREYAVALTIDDNSYMGLISASILDFRVPCEHTQSPMFWFPRGKTKFPASSDHGDVQKDLKHCSGFFRHENGRRHLCVSMDSFGDGRPFFAELWLSDEPKDSMVIATPFKENKKAFYYNQKIVGFRAEGQVLCEGKEYLFDQGDSFALLDWGRGVWTYGNTWYWGAGMGEVDGHVIGFNLGYGFGDTSAATENMLFVDGKAQKLGQIDFGIPRKGGKDEYLSPWHFTASDGRFDMEFRPILNRSSRTNVLLIESDQHQVFGRFTGNLLLDDGSKLALNDFPGFAEKVRNRW